MICSQGGARISLGLMPGIDGQYGLYIRCWSGRPTPRTCPALDLSGGRLRLPSGLAFHSTPFDFARDSTALGLRSALAQLIGRCGDSRRSGGAPYGETLRPTRLRPERRPLLKATSGDTVCGRSRRASLDLAAAHPQFRRLRRHRCTDAAERAEPASRRLYVGGPIAEGRALGQVKLLAVVGDLGALCLGPRCPSCTSSRCSHRTCGAAQVSRKTA